MSLPRLNKSRQPTPGVLLAEYLALLARRGCAHRWPSIMRRRVLIIVVLVVAIALAGILGWLTNTPPSSSIKIASAFAPKDVKKIRHAISLKNLQGLGAAVTALNYRRFSTSLRLLCFSRIESIAGYPGPPGGARVEGRVGRYSTCAYMVFNSTNGWTCQSADLISPPVPPVSSHKGYGKS